MCCDDTRIPPQSTYYLFEMCAISELIITFTVCLIEQETEVGDECDDVPESEGGTAPEGTVLANRHPIEPQPESSGQSTAPPKLYPSLSGYMDGKDHWGRIRKLTSRCASLQ